MVGIVGPMSGGGCTLPFDLSYDACNIIYPPLPCEWTHAYENITFPQLRLRAVIIPYMGNDGSSGESLKQVLWHL